MPKITAHYPELVDALRPLVGDVDAVRRVVIDIQAGHAPVVHIERVGDPGVIDVVRALDGIEVSRTLIDETAGVNPGDTPQNSKEA